MRYLALFLSFTLCTGMLWAQNDTACPKLLDPPVNESLQKQYNQAVAETKVPTREHIYKDLTPIIPGVSGKFNKNGQVLLVTWTKCDYFSQYKQGDSLNLYGDTWFSVFPEMKEFCNAAKAEDIRLRIAQRLGMPPDSNNNVFVQLWVDLEDIFRPCPDPEIYDTQCVTRIPFIKQETAKGTPWKNPGPEQQGDAFMEVDESHLQWNRSWWNGAHLDCPRPQSKDECYPWTALGYTWDWNEANATHVGGSEYVVLSGAPVVFDSMTFTDEYCGRN